MQLLEDLITGELAAEAARAALLELNAQLSAELLANCVRMLKAHQVPFTLQIPKGAIDVCGTGGDKKSAISTFNISTAVAFVLAACGVPVVKHSNRAASSQSGSVDVLDALQVPTQLTDVQAQKKLDTTNLLFVNAAQYYPSLRALAPVRKSLGVPTIFNLAGPLANPAPVDFHMTGCFADDKAQMMADAYGLLGARHFAVIHAADGLDEISPAAPTHIYQAQGVTQVTPADFGFSTGRLEDICGGNAAQNARIIKDIFEGQRGPCRDVVVMNAAYGMYLRGADLQAARAQAEAAINKGVVRNILKAMQHV